ncbi:cysteine hydrolase family protein [Kiloniella laminariae]|uniref:Cysteine hydrolase family protein n=1 Tax=Kiloniella laminariae TaxID=454162 RepID=A0ABT4LJ67_9PROT|nr:cysteine hydrolase family protein [Kiloniella laminariae]MCZ4281117.1 cysteine hydrolase family protein [Kiloniella laminariae]
MPVTPDSDAGKNRKGLNLPFGRESALLVVDVQQAIDDPRWAEFGPRNNPQAEQVMAAVLADWRRRSLRVIHIRHDSSEAASTYCPGTPGHAFKPEVVPCEGELVLGKRVNSAFIGTDLDQILRDQGIRRLLVMGVITNNSVEATVRMAGNLGYDTLLLADTCFTFARPDFSGVLRSAEEVHNLSLANLDGEYCQVVSSKDVIAIGD